MEDKDSFDSCKVSYFPHKFKDIWERTKYIFNKEIKTISDINETFYEGKSKLFKEIEQSYPEEGLEFIKVYPNIRSLVLDSDKLFKDEIIILESNTTNKIILTRKQVALIFIFGFFDIFLLGIEKMRVNNRYIFCEILNSDKGVNLSKGRSFLNYLTVIGKWLEEKNLILEEKVYFIREKKNFDVKNFYNIKTLCDLEIIEEGSLFDSEASFCVDFANKFIGGGVLRRGCVQEEILFAVEPEAIVSMFLMEKMEAKDAIRIDNLIKYSNYSGYSRTFKYEGNALKDGKIIRHNIIAIDAIFDLKSGGLEKEFTKRDLIKAYVGFNLINFKDKEIPELKKTIATGNWGCGAFGGDYELKFIQQWLGATYAGVEKLYYYTFNIEKMKFVIQNFEAIKSLNVEDLYSRMIGEKLIKGKVLEIILNSKIEGKNQMDKINQIDEKNKTDKNNKKEKGESKKKENNKKCCIY